MDATIFQTAHTIFSDVASLFRDDAAKLFSDAIQISVDAPILSSLASISLPAARRVRACDSLSKAIARHPF
jgi:hypothetical protein